MEISVSLIAGMVIALCAAFTVLRAVRIVPQARARNVERLGRCAVCSMTRRASGGCGSTG